MPIRVRNDAHEPLDTQYEQGKLRRTHRTNDLERRCLVHPALFLQNFNSALA